MRAFNPHVEGLRVSHASTPSAMRRTPSSLRTSPCTLSTEQEPRDASASSSHKSGGGALGSRIGMVEVEASLEHTGVTGKGEGAGARKGLFGHSATAVWPSFCRWICRGRDMRGLARLERSALVTLVTWLEKSALVTLVTWAKDARFESILASHRPLSLSCSLVCFVCRVIRVHACSLGFVDGSIDACGQA
jgi:hypothetical protein